MEWKLIKESAGVGEYLSGLSQEEVKDILASVDKSKNARYNELNFTKYLDSNYGEFVGLFDNGKCLALGVVERDNPFPGYCFLLEVQSFEKGCGKQLILDVISENPRTWLLADPSAEESLVSFYKKPEFGFEETTVENSIWDCPLHVFYTHDCDPDKMEEYIISQYSK